ncbi:hypothetical protein CDV31_001362 [Fusarium ambrosium]|uniref:Uncharacterized protein n=1 Tax=Fusarium ambrosium TaxID=131363 RepID=A0A428UZM8_9HYPO|nr:hypothetical protein CDV31_001362 [Fusarium ambrosium]
MSSSEDSSDEERHEQERPVHPLYIPANNYAIAYKSTWTLPNSGMLEPEDIALLQHVNCSYLSSGRPPTLLALKQHAQCLANLIRKLAPTLSGCAVDILGDDQDEDGSFKDQAFDWLACLDKPYENDDVSHHEPLWALANTVKEQSEMNGITHHCPLTRVPDTGSTAKQGATRRPYMTHHDLVMHANECLEILDHEYSSTGGLMSLLPIGAEGDTDDDRVHFTADELAGARNTLLGQWLLHHQHLVGRMHELEISYANALDLLAGEADVPLQLMSRNGVDGISGGREVAYPQDKFVLVNIGDDITNYIHRMIDVAEAQIEQKEKIWRASGVSGERMWMEERGGKVYARGIVPVDIMTRFYRIKGKGHKSPLFVIPAAEQHPGVQHTRRIEERPTIVSVVTPTWPQRVSEWETKQKAKLDQASKMDVQNQTLIRDRIELQDMLAVKDAELRRQRLELSFHEKHLSEEEADVRKELISQLTAYEDKMEELRSVLPSKYHNLLDIDTEPEEGA